MKQLRLVLVLLLCTSCTPPGCSTDNKETGPPSPIAGSIEIDGVSITLNRDGTWSGDPAAFEQKLLAFKGPLDPNGGIISWLILNQIKRGKNAPSNGKP